MVLMAPENPARWEELTPSVQVEKVRLRKAAHPLARVTHPCQIQTPARVTGASLPTASPCSSGGVVRPRAGSQHSQAGAQVPIQDVGGSRGHVQPAQLKLGAQSPCQGPPCKHWARTSIPEKQPDQNPLGGQEGLCFSLLSLQPLRDSLPGPATPLLRTVEPGPALGGPTLTSRPSLAGPPPCGRLHLTCPHSPIRNKQSVPGGAGPDCP
ncbi:uncharacterized protein [Symphalangus syndactylus]|uniref:uncharacterized protein isoform X2 n=1 Tax=Symphalangus syndactylus TaxID=9590 RepID=UPI0030058A88